MSKLGREIRFFREAAGLSLEDVAVRSSLSTSYIYAVEHGRAVNLTMRTLCTIAIAIKVDPAALVAVAVADCMASLRSEIEVVKYVPRRRGRRARPRLADPPTQT